LVTAQGRQRLGLEPDYTAAVRRLWFREVDTVRSNHNGLYDRYSTGAKIEILPPHPKSLSTP
jgi:hypothetical protein